MPEVRALTGQPVDATGHSMMRDAIETFFQHHGARYTLRVQLCVDTARMPIVWRPSACPPLRWTALRWRFARGWQRAARSAQLRDLGENAPEHWEPAFEPGRCHLALTIYARDDAALDAAIGRAIGELDRAHGVTLLGTHRFGADADAANPFGFRDSISQQTIAGSGVEPVPGQQRAVAAGEFVLGENSETGTPLGLPEPAGLGRNGSFVVLRKYRSRVGAFNDFVREHAGSGSGPSAEAAQDKLAARLFGRWRSGAPLVLAPDHDDPELGADPQRNNDFDFADDPG